MRKHGTKSYIKAEADVTRCGCCWRAVPISKEGVVSRLCGCLARMIKQEACFMCGRCSEHCCKTGWKRPATPGQRGPRPGAKIG